MGDLLYGASAKDLARRRGRISGEARLIRGFRDELARQDTLAELSAFSGRWSTKPLPAFCLNELLKAFMNKAKSGDSSAWRAAAGFWETAVRRRPEYRSDEIGRELYIVALNKSGRVADSIVEAKRYIHDLTGRSARVDTSRIRPGRSPLNGEVLAGIGKAFYLIYQKAQKGEPIPGRLKRLVEKELGLKGDRGRNLDHARAALGISTRYYEAGFVTDFEYYPGIVSVYNNYERGNVQRADQLAPLVWAATQRAGGREAKDYWCLATQVELSLIMDRRRDFADLFPRMLRRANVGWELSSTVDKMKMLVTLRERKGQDTGAMRFAIATLGERIKTLDANERRIEAAKGRGAAALAAEREAQSSGSKSWLAATSQEVARRFGVAPASASAAQRRRERITSRILESTGDFRSMTASHAIGGNVIYGGQIPDTTLSRQSVRVVRQLLARWKLDRVTDFATWNRRVDAKLNRIFCLQKRGSRRRPMEDLHSPEHGVLDGYDRKRFGLAATGELGDSRTDLLAIMALGVGDCRPTAFAKQLLFDVWRRDHTNSLMRRAFDAAVSGDGKKRDAALDRVARTDRKQLRVMTVQIDAPLRMKEMYSWITDARGRPRRDPRGRYNPAENHTFNVLVELDDRGLVKDTLRAADAFYRELYPLAGARLKASDILRRGGFRGGQMGVRDESGRRIPFQLRPTEYSGSLFKPFEVGSSDFRYAGHAVAPAVLGTMLEGRRRNNNLAREISEVEDR
jgi:hypothetical protein